MRPGPHSGPAFGTEVAITLAVVLAGFQLAEFVFGISWASRFELDPVLVFGMLFIAVVVLLLLRIAVVYTRPD